MIPEHFESWDGMITKERAPLVAVGQAWLKLEDAQDAVKKYLQASGHDLCHENRRELAEAFGLADVVPAPPKDRQEFREKCHEYEDSLYGKDSEGRTAS